jgi:hypothetical protein
LTTTIASTMLAIIPIPNTALTATTGVQAMTPGNAAQIDRKLDDGSPINGDVQAYGTATSCYSTVAPYSAASPGYLENVGVKDCGLYFKING